MRISRFHSSHIETTTLRKAPLTPTFQQKNLFYNKIASQTNNFGYICHTHQIIKKIHIQEYENQKLVDALVGENTAFKKASLEKYADKLKKKLEE
jgi:hypothetical protein